MKKIIAVLLALACAFAFCACAKKDEGIKKELTEDIPKAYVGDVDVQQHIQVADLEIIIKDTIFYVNDIMFRFAAFEKTEKLSTQFGDGMLDVYVKDGKLQKCVVYSGDNTSIVTYNIDGKSSEAIKKEIDAYGNTVYEARYDSAGALQGFYTASYDKITLLEKRTYSAEMDLTSVIKYEYDKKGNLLREITYDADLTLKDVKEK